MTKILKYGQISNNWECIITERKKRVSGKLIGIANIPISYIVENDEGLVLTRNSGVFKESLNKPNFHKNQMIELYEDVSKEGYESTRSNGTK